MSQHLGSPHDQDRPVIMYDSVDQAIVQIGTGKAVVVIDDHHHDHEGSLLFAAATCTTELLAFTVRHTSGYVCVPLAGDTCDRLGLQLMTAGEQDRDGVPYTVTVDARLSTGTGISAADRATTIRLLAETNSGAGEFSRPGHVVPLRTRDGGVLARPGRGEAAVDLARLAGLSPAGVICGIVGTADPTRMATPDELRLFADQFALPMITISDLITWRRKNEKQVRRVTEGRIPTVHGQFQALGYLTDDVTEVHTALTLGDLSSRTGPVPVAVHMHCAMGEVFGSLDCRCAQELDSAMAQVSAAGRGVVVCLRDFGDTASHGGITESGYAIAAQILDDLGITDCRPTRPGNRVEPMRAGILFQPGGSDARYVDEPWAHQVRAS